MAFIKGSGYMCMGRKDFQFIIQLIASSHRSTNTANKKFVVYNVLDTLILR